jgi:hypothetical protein
MLCSLCVSVYEVHVLCACILYTTHHTHTCNLKGKQEEGKKEEVAVFLELGPEDDIGLAVMQVCERKRLSDVACQVPSPERARARERASE